MSKRLRKQVFKLLKLKSRGEKVFPNIYPTRLWLNSSQPDKGRLPSKEALKCQIFQIFGLKMAPF